MARSAVTLGTAVDLYLDLVEQQLKPETHRQYTLILRPFVASTGENLGIRSLNSTHMEAYFLTGKHARKAKVSPSTYNKERAVVNGFVNYCIQRAWVVGAPMARIRPIKYVRPNRLRLTARELLSCLEAQHHPRDRAILAIGMNTGMRASEIRTLRIKDLNLDEGRLWLVRHKTMTTANFPVNRDLDAEMRRWLTAYTEFVARQGLSCEHDTCHVGGKVLCREWYLIPALITSVEMKKLGMVMPRKGNLYLPWPERPIRPAVPCIVNIHAPVHRGLKALGYPIHQEGLHTIRRSAALCFYKMMVGSEGAARDEALRMTQRMLGHASVTITERYLGMSREDDLLDEAMMGQGFLSHLSLAESTDVVPIRRRAVNDEGDDE